jgi:hypothetical protein
MLGLWHKYARDCKLLWSFVFNQGLFLLYRSHLWGFHYLRLFLKRFRLRLRRRWLHCLLNLFSWLLWTSYLSSRALIKRAWIWGRLNGRLSSGSWWSRANDYFILCGSTSIILFKWILWLWLWLLLNLSEWLHRLLRLYLWLYFSCSSRLVGEFNPGWVIARWSRRTYSKDQLTNSYP